MPPLEDHNVLITSMISHRTGRPRVDIQVGAIHVQVSTLKALEIARMITECVSSADADSFVYWFITDRVCKGDREKGAAVIEEFRAWREREQLQQQKEGD